MRARKWLVAGALIVLLPGAGLVVGAAFAAEVTSDEAAEGGTAPSPPAEEPAPRQAADSPETAGSDEVVPVPSLERGPAAPVTVVVAPAGAVGAAVPAQIRFRNEVGGRLRLVDASFWIDGRPVPVSPSVREAAANRSELLLFSGRVLPGPHVVTTRLQYQSTGQGPFTYVKGYRFNVENVGAFVVPADTADAAFTIVGAEHAGGVVTRTHGERLQVRVERTSK
jgi:hypothetical protein